MPKHEREFHRPPAPWIARSAGNVAQVLSVDEQTGAFTRLSRIAPGADTIAQGMQRHACWEEVYIVEGRVLDLALDEWFEAGMYAVRPPGMAHGPWRAGPEGVLMLEWRYGMTDPAERLAPELLPDEREADLAEERRRALRIVRRWVRAVNERDFDAFDELVAEDYRNHTPPPGGQPEGRDGLKRYFAALCAAIEDLRYEVRSERCDEDVVTVRLAGRGRHSGGEAMGRAPSGEEVLITVTHRYRVRDGRIVERWGDPDDPPRMRPAAEEALAGDADAGGPTRDGAVT